MCGMFCMNVCCNHVLMMCTLVEYQVLSEFEMLTVELRPICAQSWMSVFGGPANAVACALHCFSLLL